MRIQALVTSLLVAVMLPTSLLAQIGETHYFDKWRLSEGVMLNFDGAQMPTVTSDTIPYLEGPNHMICDPMNGELLFTTTGHGIYTRLGQFMPNASDYINGSPRAVIPHPGNMNLFYVLSWDEGVVGRLSYSIVDMTLNGGLGDVVSGQKRVGFGPLVTQSMKAFSDPSGLRHWLVAHKQYSTEFAIFSIDNLIGLDTVPSLYSVQPQVGGIYSFYLQAVTVNGDRMAAREQPSSGTWLYTLDPFNGSVSGGMQIPTQPFDYQLEFSPSGQFLYSTSMDAPTAPLYQFDLLAGDVSAIVSSMYTFPADPNFDTNGGGQLRLGPDGRLWIRPPSNMWGLSHLSWVQNPDQPGAAAGLAPNGFDLAHDFLWSIYLPWTFWPYAPLVGIPQHTQLRPSIELQAVPNPANTICTFVVKGDVNDGQLRIFDLTGKLVRQQRLAAHGDRIMVDVSSLPPGIYVAQVLSSNGIHQAMTRWVKE